MLSVVYINKLLEFWTADYITFLNELMNAIGYVFAWNVLKQ